MGEGAVTRINVIAQHSLAIIALIKSRVKSEMGLVGDGRGYGSARQCSKSSS